MSLFSRSHSREFDLDAYLARIRYTGDRTATLQTLQAVAFRHPLAIPFENLDPLLRRPVALDAASLQEKLVRSRRGGWCFEHNLLLGHALTAMGFAVTGFAARVLWGVPPVVVRPRTHMLLRVDLEEPFLVDAGFGGLTLTGPLRCVPDIEQKTPHEMFRIRPSGSAARNPSSIVDAHVVEAHVRGEWRPLYSFDTQPQIQADYEVGNWYLCNHPESHFLSTVMAARADTDRRYALRNGELTVHYADGRTDRTVLETGAQVRRVLDEVFHIRVSGGDEVDAAIEQVLRSVRLQPDPALEDV